MTYDLRKRPHTVCYQMNGSSGKRMRTSGISQNAIAKQNNRKFCGINKLPAELLVKIFEQLDVPMRMSIERVCRRWKNIGSAYSWSKTTKIVVRDLLHSFVREPNHRNWVYMRHCLKYMKETGNSTLCSLMDRCGKYVKNVDLSKLEDYINFASCWSIVLQKIPASQLQQLDISNIEMGLFELEQLAGRFGTLKSAILERCFKIATSLDQFLSMCCSLETLDLSRNNVGGTTFTHLPSSLKSLIFNCCTGASDFMLAQIPIRCPNLESLLICETDQDRNISSQTLNAFFQFKNLEMLVIRGDFCGQLNQRFQLQKLSHLEIIFDNFLSNTFLQSVGRCSQLKTLFLYDTAPDQELHYARSELLQLANLQRLESLSLVGFRNLSDETMKTIAKSNPNLKKLVVSFSLLTDDSIQYIVDNCKQLHNLVVANCERVSMETVETIISRLDKIYGKSLPEKGDQLFHICCCNTAIQENMLKNISCPWLKVIHDSYLGSQCINCYFFPL